MPIAADRRTLLLAVLAGTAVSGPVPGVTAPCRRTFDRTAYDRYIGLMNAGDLRFVNYYADDIRFVMNLRGRAAVLDFYARQRPYVRERLRVDFFCSDKTGAAARVVSEIRCIQDCDDTRIFGRSLKAGDVQQVRGCLLYVLDARGLIAAIEGSPPEILRPWGNDRQSITP